MTEDESKEWFEKQRMNMFGALPVREEERYLAFEARILSKYVLLERGSNEEYERWKDKMVRK